jgi:hypothetical protein
MMDLDPEARRVLELARAARTPSIEDRDRVEKRLALALSMAAVAAPATAVAAKTIAGSGLAKGATGFAAIKWLMGGGALLAAAVGGYVSLARPVAPHAAKPAKVAQHVEAPAVEPELPVAEPALAAAEEAPSEASPVPARAERKRARAKRDPLAAELTLLHRAQTAWRGGEAASALGLLREHQQRFPRSDLALERDALQVLTLCELGQKAQATRIAQKLITRAPSSPLRTSIEESCALR